MSELYELFNEIRDLKDTVKNMKVEYDTMLAALEMQVNADICVKGEDIYNLQLKLNKLDRHFNILAVTATEPGERMVVLDPESLPKELTKKIEGISSQAGHSARLLANVVDNLEHCGIRPGTKPGTFDITAGSVECDDSDWVSDPENIRFNK